MTTAIFTYNVGIEIPTDNDTAFGTIVPDLAGCYSAGDTLEEALENTKEAIYAHLEILSEATEIKPPQTRTKFLAENPQYKDFTKWEQVQIDVSKFIKQI